MTGTIVGGYVNIQGGTQVLEVQDKNGDVWERTRQLPFIRDGHLTPLGKLADLIMRG